MSAAPPLIDTHVNLHHEAFADDRAAVIARARAVGVGPMITICDQLANAATVAEAAEGDPAIFMSLGAHPHHAKDHTDLTAERLVEMAARYEKVVAIGETGLDQHYNYSPIADQASCLREHIAAARALDLPVIIHTRDADVLMEQILTEEMARGRFRVLLHCYTSGQRLADAALEMGAYLSFSGIMTFKKAHDVRAVALNAPLDRIVLETDCPYLAPEPHRGRRCEPAFLADVQRFFCQLRGLDQAEGADRIAANVAALFPRLGAA
jgi:TatD DNase family protein